MIRDFFRKHRWLKYGSFTVAMTAVCTLALMILIHTDVFGKFKAKEPYVVGDAVVNTVTVTSEGGNQKGKEGSGAKPCSPEVPTCEGKKGSKTNPFVVLEIVPDKSQQQLIYLNADNPECPFDFLQMGIDACSGNTVFTKDNHLVNYGKLTELGNWFYDYNYEVFKTDGSGDKETKKFVEIGRLYQLTISKKDIVDAGYTVENFLKTYKDGNVTMSDLKKEFPNLFQNDTKSKAPIPDKVIADDGNWTKSPVRNISVPKDEIEEADQNLSITDLAAKYPSLFQTDTEGESLDESDFKDSSLWSRSEKSEYHQYEVASNDMVITDDVSKMSVPEIAEKYPSLFKKDKDGKNIPSYILEKKEGWGTSKYSSDKEMKKGYFIYVGAGKGDLKNKTSNANQYYSSFQMEKKTVNPESDGYDWIYSETKPSGEQYFSFKEKYHDSDKEKYYAIMNNTVDDTLVGGYFSCSEFSNAKMIHMNYTFRYGSNETEYVFSTTEFRFRYYGLKATDVLKRSLFKFSSEAECNNFNMKIIAMTPSEINAIAKKDTDDTVDMIERADMYFIQSGDLDGSTVNDTEMLENMYYKYVEPSETKSDEDITFYENDLEWSLCQKIIQRQSSVQTLPLVFNQMVGKLLELGISRNTSEKETHMYVTEGDGKDASSRLTDVPAKGSRNNLSKLYLISIQFDLLARKSNTESYERTFMEDIYPNIKTISLPNEDGVVKGTASTTGYYSGTIANPRKLCTCDSVSQEFKERAYYLWNTYTFLPTDIKEQLNGNLSDETKENLISQGYQDSFFDTNDGNAFSGSSSPSHQSGSDGQDGKNVTIVSDSSNSNTPHSSILGNKGDCGGIANNTFEIVYEIMNNQTEDVKPVTVIAVEQRKMYVKIADDTVMIDHEADGKTEADKELYLKVRFWNNENNRSGQVKSIKFVNEKNGDKKTMKLYTDKTFTKECENWKENENQYIVSVDDAYLEGYIRFSLNDWKKGYTTMRFETVGWIYNAKKKKEIEGSVIKSDISIIGKTLFDLE